MGLPFGMKRISELKATYLAQAVRIYTMASDDNSRSLIPLTGPYRLESTALSNRLAASRKHS